MKIGIVGLGSMGKRRVRLLQKIDPQLELIGIDAREDRRSETEQTFGIRVTDSLEDAIENYGAEAIVVSTSPLSHSGIIRTALSMGCHVFTELNLVDDLYEENMAIAAEKDLVLFLSSTMLFREEIGYIAGQVKASSLPVNYSYHVGQYLPTWHTWESYKDFFVADRRTNGCREVFAIELPWIIHVFGEIEDMKITGGRMTDLDIDYPDHYEVIVKHAGGSTGTMHVNVASQHAVRNLEVYGQECYLRWEGTPDSLNRWEEESGRMEPVRLYETTEQINEVNRSIIEDAYEKELTEFIGSIRGTEAPRYSFEEDSRVLRLIDRIEGAIDHEQ